MYEHICVVTPEMVYANPNIKAEIQAKGFDVIDFRQAKAGDVIAFSSSGERTFVIKTLHTNSCRLPMFILKKRLKVKWELVVTEYIPRPLRYDECGVANLVEANPTKILGPTIAYYYPVKITRTTES